MCSGSFTELTCLRSRTSMWYAASTTLIKISISRIRRSTRSKTYRKAFWKCCRWRTLARWSTSTRMRSRPMFQASSDAGVKLISSKLCFLTRNSKKNKKKIKNEKIKNKSRMDIRSLRTKTTRMNKSIHHIIRWSKVKKSMSLRKLNWKIKYLRTWQITTAHAWSTK